MNNGTTYNKAWYLKHRDRLRIAKREQMRKHRLDPIIKEKANRLKRERWQTRYRATAKKYDEKLKQKHFFRWRSRNFSGKGKVAPKELAALWKKQRGLCALSGRKLNRKAHLDHIVAISSGGPHTIKNLRWLDPAVNQARQNLTDREFFTLCQDVLAQSSLHGKSGG